MFRPRAHVVLAHRLSSAAWRHLKFHPQRNAPRWTWPSSCGASGCTARRAAGSRGAGCSTDVVPDEPGFGSEPRLLREDAEEQRWLHPGFTVELFRDEAEGYQLNATTPAPCWFVLWRMEEEAGAGARANCAAGRRDAELQRGRPLARCAGDGRAGAGAAEVVELAARLRARRTTWSSPSGASGPRASGRWWTASAMRRACRPRRSAGGGGRCLRASSSAGRGASSRCGRGRCLRNRWSRRRCLSRRRARIPASRVAARRSPSARPSLRRQAEPRASPRRGKERCAAASPTLADTEALTLESDFKPFLAAQRRARGQERRLQEAVRRSAFQRDGPAGHLHRRLLQTLAAARELLRQMASAKFLNLFDDETQDTARNPSGRRAGRTWHSRSIPGKFPARRLPMRSRPAKRPMTTTLICDCNQTMPLEPKTLGTALARERCPSTRRCAGARRRPSSVPSSPATTWWWPARRRSACSANWPQQTPGATSPIRFVNIRETGGWSRDASDRHAEDRGAAGAARLPEPEPVATVTLPSQGRLLIVGALDEAEQAAALLADTLDVTILSSGPGALGGAQERRYPVIAGRIDSLEGWLGAFKLRLDARQRRSTSTCAPAAMPASPPAPSRPSASTTRSTHRRCTSHRDCEQVCKVAGAIDFATRAADRHEAAFDLVLDLGAAPLIDWHAPPQGYFHLPGGLAAGPRALQTLLRLRELVGEFEKPKFFDYKQKLCAHSRNEQVGCNACIEVCSAHAVTQRQGTPAHRRQPEPVRRLRRLHHRLPDRRAGLHLSAHARPGPQAAHAAVDLCRRRRPRCRAAAAQPGRRPGADRATRPRRRSCGRAQGVPANVIPVGAVACRQHRHRPVAQRRRLRRLAGGGAGDRRGGAGLPRRAARSRWTIAQALLRGLGYAGTHFRLIEAAVAGGARRRARRPARHARSSVPAKPGALRGRRREAQHARTRARPPDGRRAGAEGRARRGAAIPLPAGAPFGAIAVDKDKCTLCLACVSACPASALQDNPNAPQLRFIEKNCVQCGLCDDHLPRGRDLARAAPAGLARAHASRWCSTRPSPGPASAAASPSARRRRSRPCSASWPATRCSRARRWSASRCAATAGSSTCTARPNEMKITQL